MLPPAGAVKESFGPTPLPLSGRSKIGWSGSLQGKRSDADRPVAYAVGAKPTVNVRVPPAVSVNEPAGANEKSPGLSPTRLGALQVSVEVVGRFAFDTVIDVCALVLGATPPKSYEGGADAMLDSVAGQLRLTAGAGASESPPKVSVAVRVPTADGWQVTVTGCWPPAPMETGNVGAVTV